MRASASTVVQTVEITFLLAIHDGYVRLVMRRNSDAAPELVIHIRQQITACVPFRKDGRFAILHA